MGCCPDRQRPLGCRRPWPRTPCCGADTPLHVPYPSLAAARLLGAAGCCLALGGANLRVPPDYCTLTCSIPHAFLLGHSSAQVSMDRHPQTHAYYQERDPTGYIAAILLPDGAKEIDVGAPALVLVEEQVRAWWRAVG